MAASGAIPRASRRARLRGARRAARADGDGNLPPDALRQEPTSTMRFRPRSWCWSAAPGRLGRATRSGPGCTAWPPGFRCGRDRRRHAAGESSRAAAELQPSSRRTPSIDGELAAILDQEVNRLPAKYRSPIVLCYLQGHTHEEAARQLKWPLGTREGEARPGARPAARPAAAARNRAGRWPFWALRSPAKRRPSLDREILEQTVSNCMKVTLGQASVDAVSVSIASLVKGALSAMIVEKLKWAGFAVSASGLALAGAAVMARQGGAARPAPEDARQGLRALVDNRLNAGRLRFRPIVPAKKPKHSDTGEPGA